MTIGIAARTFLRHPVSRFAAAALVPLLMLVIGTLLGGFWAFFGFLGMTGFLFAADQLARRLGLAQPEMADDPLMQRLTTVIAGTHFVILPFAVWALAGGLGLGVLPWLFAFLGFGLWFGHVSNATAHELIHRSERWRFVLGMWIYISLLFGHHTSTHRLVHHRFVATPDDPNTAALGESFYAFASRAWPGGFTAGYEMENALRQARDEVRAGLHPYTVYLAGAAAWVMAMGVAFGFWGVIVYVMLCAHAQAQLLLSDYVQHYGLERRRTGMDSYEPFGPEHSWDAPDLVSGLMMLNAPRHADHHAHPSRAYPELVLSPDGQAPLLPYSLPVMATVALVPPAWFRLMDRRTRPLHGMQRPL
jgi:alkane 1-monooxygenase